MPDSTVPSYTPATPAAPAAVVGAFTPSAPTAAVGSVGAYNPNSPTAPDATVPPFAGITPAAPAAVQQAIPVGQAPPFVLTQEDVMAVLEGASLAIDELRIENVDVPLTYGHINVGDAYFRFTIQDGANPVGNSLIFNLEGPGHTIDLDASLITDSRSYTLPDASGRLVVYAPGKAPQSAASPEAIVQRDATGAAAFSAVEVRDPADSDAALRVEIEAATILLKMFYGGVFTGGIGFGATSGNTAYFNSYHHTASRAFSLPDQSGTIALLETTAPRIVTVTASTLTAVRGGRYIIAFTGQCEISNPTGTPDVGANAQGDSYEVWIATGSTVRFGGAGTVYSSSRLSIRRECTVAGTPGTWVTPMLVLSDVATFSGGLVAATSARLTGAPAIPATGEDLVTRNQGDDRFATMDKLFGGLIRQADWVGSSTNAASGGTFGSANGITGVATTTTVGSQAAVRALPWPGFSPDHARRVNWAKFRRLAFTLSVETMGAGDLTGVARVTLGKTSVTNYGALTVYGVGVRISPLAGGGGNWTLIGTCHNGTTLTEVALGGINYGAGTSHTVARIEIRSDGAGNITWLVNGISRGTTTAGPTAAIVGNEVGMQAEAIGNGNNVNVSVSGWINEMTN